MTTDNSNDGVNFLPVEEFLPQSGPPITLISAVTLYISFGMLSRKKRSLFLIITTVFLPDFVGDKNKQNNGNRYYAYKR